MCSPLPTLPGFECTCDFPFTGAVCQVSYINRPLTVNFFWKNFKTEFSHNTSLGTLTLPKRMDSVSCELLLFQYSWFIHKNKSLTDQTKLNKTAFILSGFSLQPDFPVQERWKLFQQYDSPRLHLPMSNWIQRSNMRGNKLIKHSVSEILRFDDSTLISSIPQKHSYLTTPLFFHSSDSEYNLKFPLIFFKFQPMIRYQRAMLCHAWTMERVHLATLLRNSLVHA